MGEVKYSDRKSVFSDGLRQLIQYIHFSREEGEDDYSLENVDMEGILVLDKKEFLDEENLTESGNVKNIDFVSKLEILDTEKLKGYEY